MLNILLEVSNCLSVGSSYTYIPTGKVLGEKLLPDIQHGIRSINYWLSCTSLSRLITRVSESKWCLFYVTWLYLSSCRALNAQASVVWSSREHLAFILGWRECCSFHCQAGCCWRLQQSSSNHSIAVVLHVLWQEGDWHRDAPAVPGVCTLSAEQLWQLWHMARESHSFKCQQQWHRGHSTWADFELSECSLELHLLKRSMLESQAIHNL